jgi:exodeoxyribonuclease VII large subunit
MSQAAGRLRRALDGVLAQRRARLAAAAQVLSAVSYRNVLKRGFALVRDAAGAPLHSAGGIAIGQPIRIEFADGELAAIAEGRAGAAPANPADRKPSASRRAPGKGIAGGGQGSLF